MANQPGVGSDALFEVGDRVQYTFRGRRMRLTGTVVETRDRGSAFILDRFGYRVAFDGHASSEVTSAWFSESHFAALGPLDDLAFVGTGGDSWQTAAYGIDNMKTPSWLDLLAPLGTFVPGADVIMTPLDYLKYPRNTKRKLYIPHAIVRPDGGLTLLAQVLGQYVVAEAGLDEEEEESIDYTTGYLICGHVAAGGWLWADPEKRAAADAAAADPEQDPPEPGQENVVSFKGKNP